MWALYKKELSDFFSSLVGYIVICIFLLATGLVLWLFPNEFNITLGGYAVLDGLFVLAPFVFLFLLPAITMRMFAEEYNTGTIELLFTFPISRWQIIFSKFLAGLTIFILSLLPTLIYFYSVYQLASPVGNVDIGGIAGSYIGLILLGMTFLSLGIFSSSIANNQLIAFLIAFVLSLFFYIGFEFISRLPIFDSISLFIKSLGINDHYISLSRGVIDSRDVIYLLSLTFGFLYLTKYKLDHRSR
ncbi:MAG TPA: gliding motility-associated ABC transporter permease subunit GldF [Bacteroidales bacterium]|nr:gliding motility-associated ABC transporter permease subunit GldF [Bacteroidales bacterium]